jgi:hypothetical protein
VRWVRLSYEVLYNAFTLLLPAFAVHFFLLFPTGAAPRRRRFELLLYLPAALIMLMVQDPMLSRASTRWESLHHETLHRNLTTIYFIVYAALAVALFVRSFQRTREARERARLRAALIGTVLGLTPIVIAIFLSIFFPAAAPALRFSVFPLLLLPAAFAYAAFRHRVFDTEILVKRSVIYSLLTALLIAVYFGLVLGLGSLLHRLTGARNPLLSVVSVIVIALLRRSRPRPPAALRRSPVLSRALRRPVTLRRFARPRAHAGARRHRHVARGTGGGRAWARVRALLLRPTRDAPFARHTTRRRRGGGTRKGDARARARHSAGVRGWRARRAPGHRRNQLQPQRRAGIRFASTAPEMQRALPRSTP